MQLLIKLYSYNKIVKIDKKSFKFTGGKTMKKKGNRFITGITIWTALALIITSLPAMDAPQASDAAEKVAEITRGEADITEELTARRSKFTRQYVLTDGSFLANSYSMPVHYKKGGRWKEINTTLVKSGKKNYKTSSTDLRITVAKKANKKAEITMKRGSHKLSLALQGKRESFYGRWRACGG